MISNCQLQTLKSWKNLTGYSSPISSFPKEGAGTQRSLRKCSSHSSSHSQSQDSNFGDGGLLLAQSSPLHILSQLGCTSLAGQKVCGAVRTSLRSQESWSMIEPLRGGQRDGVPWGRRKVRGQHHLVYIDPLDCITDSVDTIWANSRREWKRSLACCNPWGYKESDTNNSKSGFGPLLNVKVCNSPAFL